MCHYWKTGSATKHHANSSSNGCIYACIDILIIRSQDSSRHLPDHIRFTAFKNVDFPRSGLSDAVTIINEYSWPYGLLESAWFVIQTGSDHDIV